MARKRAKKRTHPKAPLPRKSGNPVVKKGGGFYQTLFHGPACQSGKSDAAFLRQALNDAKSFIENAIQTANIMVIGLDINGLITFFNKSAEDITGYKRRELEGRDWFEILVPRQRYPQVWESFKLLKSGKLPRNLENPILTKNGEERFILWHNNDLLEHGKIVGSMSFGIDITAHKKLEQKLRESDDLFRSISENSMVGINIAQDGVIVYCNPQLGQIAETNPAKMIGMNPLAFVHPEDRAMVTQNMIRRLSGVDNSQRYFFRGISGSGVLKYIEVLGTRFDYKGKPAIIASLSDITRSVKAEAELKASKEMFLTAFHASPVVMTISTLGDAKYVDVNKAWEVSTGYTREEVIGKHVPEVKIWKNPGDILLLREKIQKDGGFRNLEMHVQSKALDEAIVLMSGERVDIGGSPCLLTVSIDITARRQAEKALKKSEAMFSKVFHASPAIMLIVSLNTLRYINVNRAWESATGYTRDECRGRNILEYKPWLKRQLLEEIIQKLRTDGNFRNMEAAYKYKGLEDHACLLSAETAVFDEEPCALMVVDDIDSLKALTDSLRRTNKELEAFAQTVSHDLRNPLTSIMGYSQLETVGKPTLSGTDRLDGL